MSQYFYLIFFRCGKREQTSFAHGSMNTEEKSDFVVVSIISGFEVEKCEQSSQ